MKEKKTNAQVIWGGALLLMGVLVFFAIPQKMAQIAQMDQHVKNLPYIRFCLYFVGFFLVVAGAKKIFDQYKKE